jgi:AAA family ATP:ADP antiporter
VESRDHVSLDPSAAVQEGWKVLFANRYLTLIAVMLLFSQMAEPIVEYQFMHLVEQTYTDGEARTAYLSQFLSLLSGVALAINLFITPFIHRRLGAIAGLLVQPVLLGLSALTFVFQYRLITAAVMKICDRGLSYSINRASRELLYVPADPVTIYKAKAWIDMVGYRAFKIAGNFLILLLTQWLPWQFGDLSLSWVVMALSAGWIWAALAIRGDYHRLRIAAEEHTKLVAKAA